MKDLFNFLLRFPILLLILFIDLNIASRIVIYNVTISISLASVIFLIYTRTENLEKWYLPIFLFGILKDILHPSNTLGVSSFLLVVIFIVGNRLKENQLINDLLNHVICTSIYFISGVFIFLFTQGYQELLFQAGPLFLNSIILVVVNSLLQIFVYFIVFFISNICLSNRFCQWEWEGNSWPIFSKLLFSIV